MPWGTTARAASPSKCSPFIKSRKLHSPQLRHLLIELHTVDQVVYPILYRETRIQIVDGSQLFTSVVSSGSLARLSRLGEKRPSFESPERETSDPLYELAAQDDV